MEDSPTGVASAEAAGCVTVAVAGLVEVPPAPGRIRVGSLRDLTPDRLEELVRTPGMTLRDPVVAPGLILPAPHPCEPWGRALQMT